MIYYQAVYYGRLGSYHSNKNIPSIQHRVYVSLTSYWMYENSGAGCCDFPSPLTQLEKYSTISVKRTLKGEILAIRNDMQSFCLQFIWPYLIICSAQSITFFCIEREGRSGYGWTQMSHHSAFRMKKCNFVFFLKDPTPWTSNSW